MKKLLGIVDHWMEYSIILLFRNSFTFLTRRGSQENEDSYFTSYRIGGKARKGDTDYDLLIRLLLCLIYGIENDRSMLLPAGKLSIRKIFVMLLVRWRNTGFYERRS